MSATSPQNNSLKTISLNESSWSRRNLWDWLFAVCVLVGGLYVFKHYADAMDVYEKGILVATIPSAIWLGWFWRPLQGLMAVVTAFLCWEFGLTKQLKVAVWQGRKVYFG